MADFGDVLKLAFKIGAALDELEDAKAGEEVELPEIKIKVGGERWTLGPIPAKRTR